MNENFILTIAIPTYNRNKFILERLKELQPLLSPSVEVIVIDNASKDPVEESIRSSLEITSENIRFIRNKTNIGGGANVCKCFEEAKGKWVWVLGDDDKVFRSSVTNILNTISQSPKNNDWACINFSTSIYQWPSIFEFGSLDDYWELVKMPKTFSNMLLISASVHFRDSALQSLNFAYQNIFSCGPQLVLMLKSLQKGGKVITSTLKIVDWESPTGAEKWNKLIVYSGIPLLAEIPGDQITCKNLHMALSRYAPNLSIKSGLKFLFLEDEKGVRFSYIYYSRLYPLLQGKTARDVFILRSLSWWIIRFPILRELARNLLLKKGLTSYDGNIGSDRM